MGEFRYTAILLLAAAVCGACSGSEPALQDSQPATITPPLVELRVLEQTFVDGGTAARITRSIVPDGPGFAVEIVVEEARNLKALFFELEYDAAHWQPAGIKSTGLLAPPDGLVELSHVARPGLASHGEVLRNFDEHEGFTGSGVLARVAFHCGSGDSELAKDALWIRETDAILDKCRLYVNHLTDSLHWSYVYNGDYDQNGEVGLSDIVPIALHFGDSYAEYKDDWKDDGIATVIDGDRNGYIGLSDLVPVSIHFGNRISEFRMYSTKNYAEDYPQAASYSHQKIPLLTVEFAESGGDPANERIYWEKQIGGLDYFALYWVQPVLNGDLYQPSNIAFEEESEFPRFEPLYDLQYEQGSLRWQFNLRADGDNNGGVNSADLTQVAFYLNSGGGEPFTPTKPQYVIDFDRDGYIRRDDEAYALATSYGKEIHGFLIYSTQAGAVPPDSPESPPVFPHMEDIIFEGNTDWLGDHRNWFEYHVDALSGSRWWVRPVRYDDFGEVDAIGPRSEVIQIP